MKFGYIAVSILTMFCLCSVAQAKSKKTCSAGKDPVRRMLCLHGRGDGAHPDRSFCRHGV